MEIILITIFIICGLGVPILFTIKNSKPKNVFIRIINELKEQPKELWYHFFTLNGLERWIEEKDLKIGEIQNLEILEQNYKNYIWKYKVKFTILDKERNYFFELIKNPDIRAKSRWVINNIYEV